MFTQTVSCECGNVKITGPMTDLGGKLYRIKGVKCRVCGTYVPEMICSLSKPSISYQLYLR